jgi:hypothetical protein
VLLVLVLVLLLLLLLLLLLVLLLVLLLLLFARLLVWPPPRPFCCFFVFLPRPAPPILSSFTDRIMCVPTPPSPPICLSRLAFLSAKAEYATATSVCTVFPSPISSARTPCKYRRLRNRSHATPSRW